MYTVQVVSLTHVLPQGYIFENGSHHGNGEQSVHSMGKGGGTGFLLPGSNS